MIHVSELRRNQRIRLKTGHYMTLTDDAACDGVRHTTMGGVMVKWIAQAKVGEEWMAVDHSIKEQIGA